MLNLLLARDRIGGRIGSTAHYMDNRKTHLGYLVVFDARVNLFGQQLLPPTSGPYTVIEKIVDVRNRVKQA